MFPFNLKGPEFLVFFLLLAIILGVLARTLRREWDPIRLKEGAVQDPFLLAFLCGGRRHLLRVAVLLLIDRQKLQVNNNLLRTVSGDSCEETELPLNQAILECNLIAGSASRLFENSKVLKCADEIEKQLMALQLLPDQELRGRRFNLFFGLAFTMLSISLIKIVVALNQGHKNIIILVILSVIIPIIFYKICCPFHTEAGSKAVAHAKKLFVGLYARRKSLALHSPTQDLVILASVYSISSLPDAVVKIMKDIKLCSNQSQGSSGSCGSGSCGGGGCGGGGGGCGGCGGG